MLLHCQEKLKYGNTLRLPKESVSYNRLLSPPCPVRTNASAIQI